MFYTCLLTTTALPSLVYPHIQCIISAGMADGAGRRSEVLLGFGERRQVVDRSLKLGAFKNASESRVSYEHRM